MPTKPKTHNPLPRMTTVDLPVGIKSVEVLRLEPGDYLVCALDQPLQLEGRKNIQAQFADVLAITTNGM